MASSPLPVQATKPSTNRITAPIAHAQPVNEKWCRPVLILASNSIYWPNDLTVNNNAEPVNGAEGDRGGGFGEHQYSWLLVWMRMEAIWPDFVGVAHDRL